MKGVILAGGTGSRLAPMTRVTNKHLLPVYDKPMIMYPLQTLINAGLKDIMIISGKGHAGHFLELLGSGKEYGVRLSYAVQEEPKGIAHALSLAEDFADDENIAVILGDNLYEDNFDFGEFQSGARIYLKEVPDPQRFGVASLDGNRVIKIIEKPTVAETPYAVSGLYLYDTSVFEKVKDLELSARGEYEITDVNNKYIEEQKLEAYFVKGFWTDAGTVESLHKASVLIRELYGK
jgi:glucose-1-phosphate thymidylyltransferase